jgi:hypothetical protein
MAYESLTIDQAEPKRSKKGMKNVSFDEAKATGQKSSIKAALSNPSTMDKYKTEMEQMKVGTILAIPTTMLLLPEMLPLYAYYRSKGNDRGESLDLAFLATWRIVAVILTPFLGPEMAKASSSVTKLSNLQMQELATMARKVSQDPQMQAKVAQAGSVLALTAASGQELDPKTLSFIGSDIVAIGGQVATRKAIESGHLSKQDVNNITKAATSTGAI